MFFGLSCVASLYTNTYALSPSLRSLINTNYYRTRPASVSFSRTSLMKTSGLPRPALETHSLYYRVKKNSLCGNIRRRDRFVLVENEKIDPARFSRLRRLDPTARGQFFSFLLGHEFQIFFCLSLRVVATIDSIRLRILHLAKIFYYPQPISCSLRRRRGPSILYAGRSYTEKNPLSQRSHTSACAETPAKLAFAIARDSEKSRDSYNLRYANISENFSLALSVRRLNARLRRRRRRHYEPSRNYFSLYKRALTTSCPIFTVFFLSIRIPRTPSIYYRTIPHESSSINDQIFSPCLVVVVDS